MFVVVCQGMSGVCCLFVVYRFLSCLMRFVCVVCSLLLCVIWVLLVVCCCVLFVVVCRCGLCGVLVLLHVGVIYC